MPGIDKFKHAILFPAPLPSPSVEVDLSTEHRNEMRDRYYGRRQRHAHHVDVTPVFKQQYGDEKLPQWESCTKSHYKATGFSNYVANTNNASEELKTTHFKIEDPSISRQNGADARDSITKTDFVPYPEAKREQLHKYVAQPYPVIYRDPNIKPETTSLYKSDFDLKNTGEQVHRIADDRANMRSTHFVLGGDHDKDRYISVTRFNEVKDLSPELFDEVTSSERRKAIKNEQSKRSNVLDFVDIEKPRWESAQKSVFVDHFQKPGFEPNSHEVNEDLRAIHFKLGQNDQYSQEDVSTYSRSFIKPDAALDKRTIVKPHRPGSTEGIQIGWKDLPKTDKPRSETSAAFASPLSNTGHDARDYARHLKNYATQTSIKFAHTEEDMVDRHCSLTKSQFVKPFNENSSKRHLKIPQSHQLWEPEHPVDYQSTSKMDFMDPQKHDPLRNEHHAQDRASLAKTSGLLRQVNFSLGSSDGAKNSSYTENFSEKKPTEPYRLYKKTNDSIHSDRIIARYPDVQVRATVYQETFKELPQSGEPNDRYAHRAGPSALTLQYIGRDNTMPKVSVTHQTYILPEVMVDRTVRK